MNDDLNEAIWHAREHFAASIAIHGRTAYLRGDDIVVGATREDRARYLAVRRALAVLAEHTHLPNREDY